MPAVATALEERFWSKVEVADGDDSCWTWTAGRNEKGYGRFDLHSRRIMAHRVAYELEFGPIPYGLQIDHLCRNHSCVRPSHLEAVTQRTNILRGEAPSAQSARATECVNGHKFSVTNTYRTPDGRRQCRVCVRHRGRRQDANRKLTRREARAA